MHLVSNRHYGYIVFNVDLSPSALSFVLVSLQVLES
uniref:Uncharacterized protein n=1 Tax=Arundo donax TaxID=35708 RepID=A0A0A9B7U2_ARUDO